MIKNSILVVVLVLCVNGFAEESKLKALPAKKIQMTVSVVAKSNPIKLRFKIVNHTNESYQLFGFHDGSGRNEVLLITPSGKRVSYSVRKDFMPDKFKLLFKPNEMRVYESPIADYISRLSENSLKVEKGDYILLWTVVLGGNKEEVFQAPPFVFTVK